MMELAYFDLVIIKACKHLFAEKVDVGYSSRQNEAVELCEFV